MPYKIRVFQLSDEENRGNPNLHSLYVRIEKFDQAGAVVVKAFPDWVLDKNPFERPDLSVENTFFALANARKKMKSLMENLRSKGHTVNRCKTVYRLYVIELEPNIEKDGEAVAVYVGETSKARCERFEEHMAGGIRASNHVYRRGLRLRSDLTPKQEYYTREASKAAEKRLAERLERKGYAVYGGH